MYIIGNPLSITYLTCKNYRDHSRIDGVGPVTNFSRRGTKNIKSGKVMLKFLISQMWFLARIALEKRGRKWVDHHFC